ncbi:MAG: hypothetical protein WCK02_02115 [Bacteroidota bacterium]
MISVDKAPACVCLIGNSVMWQLLTNNYYVTVGVNHQLNIKVVGGVVENQLLKLTFAGVSKIFICKNIPDNSGLQFRPKGVSETIAEYRNYIVLFFKSNYYLSKYYLILEYYLYPNYYLTFVAKSRGVEFVIGITTNTTDFVLTTATSGTDSVINDYFSIMMQVNVEKQLGEEELFSEEYFPVNKELKAVINIQEKFKKTFEDLTEIFDKTFSFSPLASEIAIKRNLLRKYTVNYAEFYGDIPSVKALTRSSDFYIVNGSLPIWKELELQNENSSWWDKLAYTKQFLNYCPNNKLTDLYTQEFLYFLVTEPTQNFVTYKVMCRAKFDDNSYESETLKTVSVVQYNGIELNIGLNLIQSSYPNKVILSYDIWIERMSNQLIMSEVRAFVVDSKEYEQERIYFFRNSLGVMETARFTGLAEVNNKYERTSYELLMPIEFQKRYRNKKQFSNKNSELTKANSGFKNKSTINYLQELLLSDEVYELQDANLMPIVIISNEFYRHKDDALLYSATIEYETINVGSSYSPQNSVGDFNNDYNLDFSI